MEDQVTPFSVNRIKDNVNQRRHTYDTYDARSAKKNILGMTLILILNKDIGS